MRYIDCTKIKKARQVKKDKDAKTGVDMITKIEEKIQSLWRDRGKMDAECDIAVSVNGEEDEDCEDQRSMMLFGDLFKLYTRISDKVVGILLRAKKYGLVGFEPEILFQSRDDDEPVILIKPMQEIYDIFNQHKSFAPQPTQSSNKES